MVRQVSPCARFNADLKEGATNRSVQYIGWLFSVHLNELAGREQVEKGIRTLQESTVDSCSEFSVWVVALRMPLPCSFSEIMSRFPITV